MGQAAGGDATHHHRLRAAQRVPHPGRLRFLGGQRALRLGLPSFLSGARTLVVHARLDAPVRRAKRSVALRQTRVCVRLVAQRDYETLSVPPGCFGSSHTVALARLQAQMGRRRRGG